MRRASTVRATSGGDPLAAALTELDLQLLKRVCWLRAMTQVQLERLFPDVPERTLRYRTRQLHGLGLLGRTRPYRERGSAPFYLWPTNRADALVRGRPRPRRGERRPPNPLFLDHTTALGELYVVLATHAAAEEGLELVEFAREGEAREAFADADGGARAIAPDARVELRDARGRALSANVELDLGTMTHARLRVKLDGYFAHAASRAHDDAPPPPPVLFLTTSAARAERFDATVERLRDGAPASAQPRIASCDLARRLDALPRVFAALIAAA